MVANVMGVEYKEAVNRMLLFLVGLFSVLSPVSAKERPNVLLIIVDDLNDWVGCLEGHPDALTPHIDSLAPEPCAQAGKFISNIGFITQVGYLAHLIQYVLFVK